ncbi:SprT-like domain-containing protein [Capnocytophaga cynodegmi]|uniref:SprT-like domain-containing protein n=1 Tax=Capnocytophaga cynodegmi TaxID=28189 RepID=UPI003859EE41
MKRKIQSLVIVGLLLVIAIACQREERETLESKGISLEQAKAFFEKQETEKENNGIDFKITPKWETFKEEDQKEGKSFAFAQAIINNQNERKAEILFTKIENNLEGIIIAEHYVNDNLLFLISDLEGKIISINYPQKEKTTTPESRVPDFNMCIKGEGPCLDCYRCGIALEPVPGIPGAFRYPYADPIGVCDDCREKIVQLSDVTVSHNMPFPPRIDPWNDPRIPPKRDFNEINKRFEDQHNIINNYNGYFGSRGKSNPSPKPREIIDNLTNPCAKRILNQMRSDTGRINIANLMTPEIKRKHNFSQMIIDLFEKSSQTHLTFTNGTTKNGANGSTSGTTITLNNNYLQTATQLAIARTIIHEMVHAYLNVNLRRGTSDVKDQKFSEMLINYFNTNYRGMNTGRAHHEFMGQYIEAMAISLQQWDMRYGTGTDLGFEYYKALSYGGLFQTDVNGAITTETNSFKELVPNAKDRQDIANKILNEQNNSRNAKGAKCK